METAAEFKSAGSRFLKKLLSDYLVAFAIIIFVIITSIVEPNFLTLSNFQNLMRQFGPLAFVSLGMTFVILAGYIDLSTAGVFSLVSVISLYTANNLGAGPAIVIGLAVGLAAGLINGLLLLFFGVKNSAGSLFITYGLSLIFESAALMYTGGSTIHLTKGISALEALGKGSVGIVPVSFILFLVALAVLYIFQSRTYLGRSISCTGGNPTASKLAGIPVEKCVIIIYVLASFMTAIGAIILFSRVGAASPKCGTGYDTDAIMSVVIGGTSLNGGKGSVLRTVLGVAIVTLMSNCLNLLGVSSFMQDFAQGLIMIIAIWLDSKASS